MHTCFEERSTSVKMVVRKTHDHIETLSLAFRRVGFNIIFCPSRGVRRVEIARRHLSGSRESRRTAVHRQLDCSTRWQSRIRGERDRRYRQVKCPNEGLCSPEQAVYYVKADPHLGLVKDPTLL